MNSKEAIFRILDHQRIHSKKEPFTPKLDEAFSMAIEALKDRQSEETFEWCHDCKEYDQKNYCCHRWTKVIRDTVEELRQDRRPKGEWIYHKEWELDGECAFECSKCGMGTDIDYNFCPNCGADMRTQNDRSWDTSERGVSGSVKNSIAQEEGKEK